MDFFKYKYQYFSEKFNLGLNLNFYRKNTRNRTLDEYSFLHVAPMNINTSTRDSFIEPI